MTDLKLPYIFLFFAGVAEAAFATFGGREGFDREPFGSFVACDDHLAYAVAVVDSEWVGTEVDQYNADFATIVGIDCAGSVEDCDAIFDSET